MPSGSLGLDCAGQCLSSRLGAQLGISIHLVFLLSTDISLGIFSPCFKHMSFPFICLLHTGDDGALDPPAVRSFAAAIIAVVR